MKRTFLLSKISKECEYTDLLKSLNQSSLTHVEVEVETMFQKFSIYENATSSTTLSK